jgi:Tfp pilus assembly protein FimT
MPSFETHKRQAGFSTIELMVSLGILFTVAGFVVPSITTVTRMYRMQGDARSLAVDLNLARMRAAGDYSHARAYIDLNGNTFHVEVWNKVGGCWQTDGDANACTQTTSPVTLLATGDSFGFGSISAGPTTATATIAQAPACKTGVAGTSPGTDIANTACIEFNSHGYPVDSTNTLIASDAIYITSSQKVFFVVTAPIGGQPTTYSYSGSAWSLF